MWLVSKLFKIRTMRMRSDEALGTGLASAAFQRLAYSIVSVVIKSSVTPVIAVSAIGQKDTYLILCALIFESRS
jgi:hypothetical protein